MGPRVQERGAHAARRAARPALPGGPQDPAHPHDQRPLHRVHPRPRLPLPPRPRKPGRLQSTDTPHPPTMGPQGQPASEPMPPQSPPADHQILHLFLTCCCCFYRCGRTLACGSLCTRGWTGTGTPWTSTTTTSRASGHSCSPRRPAAQPPSCIRGRERRGRAQR